MSYRIVEESEGVRRAVVFGDRRVCEVVAASIGEMLGVEAEIFEQHVRVDTSGMDATMGPLWPLAGLLLAPTLGSELIDFLHPRKAPDVASRRRQLLYGVVGLAVIAVLAGITWARFDLADRRQELEILRGRKSMLLPGYLRYGRDRYKLTHLQQWESADVNWLEHLRHIATMAPSSDQVVLDSWTGTLNFSGVKFDRKTRQFAAPKEIRIVVEGEAADRVTADGFRGALVETESYDISTAGPDAKGGRRLPWAFQYNLHTRDAVPGPG